MARPPSRRAFLAATGSALLAGCSTVPPTSDRTTAPRRTPRSGEPAGDGSWPGVGRDAGHAGYNPTVSGSESSEGWRVEFEGRASTPTVANGSVYVARWLPGEDSLRAAIEAYDLHDGTRRWTEPIRDLNLPRPVYHRGTLHFTVGRRIVAMDAESRERYWTSAFETRETSVGEAFLNDSSPSLVTGAPVVTDDGVFAQGIASVRDTESGRSEPRGVVVCFDRTGRERWRFPAETTAAEREERRLPSPIRPGLPAVMDGTVHVLRSEERYGEPTRIALRALDRGTGEVRWKRSYRATGARGPVLADGNYVLATERTPDGGSRTGTNDGWSGDGTDTGTLPVTTLRALSA